MMSDTIQSFKKSKNQRNKFDINIIAHVVKNIKFFQDIIENEKEDIYHSCCKFLQLEKYLQNDIVFE